MTPGQRTPLPPSHPLQRSGSVVLGLVAQPALPKGWVHGRDPAASSRAITLCLMQLRTQPNCGCQLQVQRIKGLHQRLAEAPPAHALPTHQSVIPMALICSSSRSCCVSRNSRSTAGVSLPRRITSCRVLHRSHLGGSWLCNSPGAALGCSCPPVHCALLHPALLAQLAASSGPAPGTGSTPALPGCPPGWSRGQC